MKKKTTATILISFMALLFVVALPTPNKQANQQDKYSDWFGPYPDGGNVYYCYIQSYLGNDTWSNDYDAYRFENKNDHAVEITYHTTRFPNTTLQTTLSANTLGDKTALTQGDRIAVIVVVDK
jgi:hypothetical protein